MAESFPSTIATNILATIAFLNSEKEGLSGHIPDEIMELEETLLKFKDDLLNAEEQQAQNHELQKSIAQLSDQLYDAEDVVDEVKCELKNSSRDQSSKRGLLSKLRSSSLPSLKKSKKLAQIIKRLDEIAVGIKSKYDQNKLEIRRLSEVQIKHTFVGTSEVFGRDGDEEKIINFLNQRNNEGEKISVIAIVGDGGIGKTTLAKQVYSDKMIEEHFPTRMWVRAPEDFDIITLMKETYTSATGQYQAGLAVNELEDRLLKELDGKKFLLVLDDVSNENYDKWDRFKNLWRNNTNGSKIVVTTRSNQVAEVMGAVDRDALEGLSTEASKLLFQKAAAVTDERNTDLGLITVGNEIAEKCGGNPLALKTLGTLLNQNREKSDWSLIRDNEGWNQEREVNAILLALNLSYAHLPSHLRRCLAYCSLFPKGYCFNSNYLVCHWMAHGFLATDNKNEELEDVGLKYLKELTWRCFFQDVEDHGYFFKFQMHDFVHDLVLKVAQTECETVDLRSQKTERNARHLSFLDIEYCDKEIPFISKKLRTIIMQSILSEHVNEAFLNKWISKFEYLRLLCLSGLQFEELPLPTGALKHLRCLDLSWNLMLKEIPEHIPKLPSLQTLRLLGCSNLQKLPHNMQEMTSLRYLEITMKEIGDWMQLQSLTSLRTLVLQGCDSLNSLPYNIKNLKGLKKLVIYSCPKINLKMDLQGEVPNLSLKVFVIYELQELLDLPQLILQGSANTLEYLRIEACPKLKQLPSWLENLEALQKLEILSCPELSSLPDGMQKLTKLRELKIQHCPTLSKENFSCAGDSTGPMIASLMNSKMNK